MADDLYSRNVMISLNQWCSPQDSDNIAAGINKVLSAYCTQDDTAVKWLP